MAIAPTRSSSPFLQYFMGGAGAGAPRAPSPPAPSPAPAPAPPPACEGAPPRDSRRFKKGSHSLEALEAASREWERRGGGRWGGGGGLAGRGGMAACTVGRVDLVDLVDFSGVECLNAAEGSWANVLKAGYREDEGAPPPCA